MFIETKFVLLNFKKNSFYFNFIIFFTYLSLSLYFLYFYIAYFLKTMYFDLNFCKKRDT